jgi:hypothetical protein
MFLRERYLPAKFTAFLFAVKSANFFTKSSEAAVGLHDAAYGPPDFHGDANDTGHCCQQEGQLNVRRTARLDNTAQRAENDYRSSGGGVLLSNLF